VDKILKLSHPKYHHKNISNTIQILLNNGYPLPFIFSNINNRIRHVLYDSTDDTTKNNKKKKFFIKVPFIENVTPKMLNITKKHNINTIFTINNKLSHIIKTGKDKINKIKCSNVVYKINCNNCDASYVGQTKRQLHTRIKEHRSDINKRTGLLSVVSLHQLNNNHEIKWDNVNILDKEHAYNNRIVSEMIHIKKQNNGLNKQNDTEQFPDLYLPFI